MEFITALSLYKVVLGGKTPITADVMSSGAKITLLSNKTYLWIKRDIAQHC